jgi:hypothetical protein
VHQVGFHYKDYQDARSAKNKNSNFISFDQVAFNVGMLYVYAMGAMENYMLMNLTCFVIPIIFVLQFMWMPETPQYFLSKDNCEGAAKSLQWLRGKNHEVQNELQQLKVSDLQLKHRQFKRTFLQSGQHLTAQFSLFATDPFTLKFCNSSLCSSSTFSPSLDGSYYVHYLA